jgi:hypothetical protein
MRWWRLLALLAALVAANLGCAPKEAWLQAEYGSSCRAAVSGQTLDPLAGRSIRPVAVMNAPEAAEVYVRYLKGFEKPAKGEPTYMIPLTSQGGSFSQGQ